jgi:cell division protein DivIC
MLIVLGSHSISLQEQRDLLIEQEEELLFQIEQQELRGLEILEFEEFVGTQEHIRIVAEEELGLVDPNAIIFRPVD